MERLGLALAGVALGTLAGAIAGLALVYIWFEGLGLPGLDDDPKGLSTAIILILPSIAVGATAAPLWLLRRRARGARLGGPLLALSLVAAAAVLLIAGLTL